MFGIRASASAVACVAAVALAVAGCKVDVPAAAGTASAGESVAESSDPGPARSGPLIIEPGAGFSPVYGLINGARRSIDVTMYEFDDTTAERDLGSAARRGVDVRVILDEREQGVNSSAFSYFRSNRVKVVWSWSRFTYTHQKTLVIDGSRAVIMTANLTSEYYPTSRDFLVVDTNRSDVAAITAVFDAGRTRTASTTAPTPGWPGPGFTSATTTPPPGSISTGRLSRPTTARGTPRSSSVRRTSPAPRSTTTASSA